MLGMYRTQRSFIGVIVEESFPNEKVTGGSPRKTPSLERIQ